jgi:hypothetical protein
MCNPVLKSPENTQSLFKIFIIYQNYVAFLAQSAKNRAFRDFAIATAPPAAWLLRIPPIPCAAQRQRKIASQFCHHHDYSKLLRL